MAFSSAFIKPFRPAFDAGLAAAAVPWYLAGGAPAPIIVWQMKAVASLAASYVNLIAPGTYDVVPGATPPTWNDQDGWILAGLATSPFDVLLSGNQNFAIMIRFSNLFGARLAGLKSGANYRQFFAPNWGGGRLYYYGSGFFQRGPVITSGVISLTGDAQGYANGAADGAAGTPTTFTSDRFTWAIDSNMYLQAVAIWNTSTDHATWMPAVMAAAALI